MWCGEHIFNPLLHHKPLQKLAGESYQFDLNLWTPNISFLKDREPNSIEARPFRAGLENSLLEKKSKLIQNEELQITIIILLLTVLVVSNFNMTTSCSRFL